MFLTSTLTEATTVTSLTSMLRMWTKMTTSTLIPTLLAIVRARRRI